LERCTIDISYRHTKSDLSGGLVDHTVVGNLAEAQPPVQRLRAVVFSTATMLRRSIATK